MPVYTFRCRKCKNEVEVTHGINQPHPKKHRGCGGRLARTITPSEVVYKGAGFYTTDKRLEVKPENVE